MPRDTIWAGEKYTAPLRLCDGDCNNCGIHINRQFSLLINVLRLRFGEEVYNITQAMCPNMTCCADCRIDDFCHVEDCEIANEAEALVAAWNRRAEEERK